MLAEIVENPLPRARSRHDVHKHSLYYAARNHIIDFLVSRSRSFREEAGAAYDPRKVAIVRPGFAEPSIARPTPAAATFPDHAPGRQAATE